MKSIVIGSDHVGLDLKQPIKEYLIEKGYEVKDFGVFTGDRMNYPEIAFRVGKVVAKGEYESGILICGTGVGMSIAANKVKGVRAAHVSEPYSSKMAKMHNNANILCMGSRVVGVELAKMIVDEWLNSQYEGGRHQIRVDLINEYENK